jgi:hypothetical protein
MSNHDTDREFNTPLYRHAALTYNVKRHLLIKVSGLTVPKSNNREVTLNCKMTFLPIAILPFHLISAHIIC